MFKLLIVDDDDNVLKSLARLFRSSEYDISCCEDPQEALMQCALQRFDIIISDQRMPDMEGTEFFTHIAKSFPQCRRILLSGYSDFGSVTEAFNEGVIHKFVIKPWDNAALKALVADQLGVKHSTPEASRKPYEPLFDDEKIEELIEDVSVENFHGIVTSDAAMLAQLSIIQRTANSDAPFFIHGETGTGKELIARAIHKESDRANESFVALNCANLTENLLESQLFGHIKGAFTGADKDQKGLLAEAEKGTLFLDEVTEIPLTLQAKLLRVLQEREYSPVGRTTTTPFDVQVISASSTSLETAVKSGRFREDLRYRLEVIPINLPPLRVRKSDFRILFEYFLGIQFRRQNRSYSKIDNEVYDCVEGYHWPGNVRELVNVCTYIAALATSADAQVTVDTLPPTIRTAGVTVVSDDEPSKPLTKEAETASDQRTVDKESLEEAIAKFSGNREAIANFFSISRMTLWRKMKQFQIEE